MEILTEEEMAARIDYRAPLQKDDPDAVPPKQSVYSIPFEYGDNRKGTVISIALARQIAAELRAEIASSTSVRSSGRSSRSRRAARASASSSRRRRGSSSRQRAKIAHLERRLRARVRRGK